MRKQRLVLLATHFAGLGPALVLFALQRSGGLGADPVGALVRAAGRWALTFLMLALLPSPVAVLTGWTGLLRARRWLGLYGFGYALAHLALLLGLDYGGRLDLIWRALREGPAMWVGLLALVLLVPLALTSTDGWVKRLGRAWQRLHRLAYPATVLAIIHYAAVFKELRPGPVLLVILVAVLEAARVVAEPRARARTRRRAAEIAARGVGGSPGRPDAGQGRALRSPRYGRTRMRWVFVLSLLLLSTLFYFLSLETWAYWALLLVAVFAGWWIKA